MFIYIYIYIAIVTWREVENVVVSCHQYMHRCHLTLSDLVLISLLFIPLCQILKEKIDFGLTLEGAQIDSHLDRETPVDVVHAYKYNKHLDDHF
jgi:hypothetical protein